MKLRNKIIAIAVVAVAGANVYFANNTNSTKFTDLQLANIESLAEAQEGGGDTPTMTSEEFTEKTDCVACWSDECTCPGKDGKPYSFAHHKSVYHN